MDELGFPSLTGYVQDCKALIVAAGAKPVNTFTEADLNFTVFLAVDSVGFVEGLVVDSVGFTEGIGLAVDSVGFVEGSDEEEGDEGEDDERDD